MVPEVLILPLLLHLLFFLLLLNRMLRRGRQRDVCFGLPLPVLLLCPRLTLPLLLLLLSLIRGA